MKKIISFLLIFLCTVFCFAEVFPGSDKIVETFYKNGIYVKYIKNQNNIYYVPKDTVAAIQIDEKKIVFQWNDNDAIGNDEDEEEFYFSKWNIESDEDGNIVISRK